MQTMRQQRMRKIMHVQGEVGSRYKEFNIKIPKNAHEILRKSVSANVRDIAVKDLTKSIVNDDFNSLKGFDILTSDNSESKLHQFKSMHNMYDLQALKITKLYKKKKKTHLETFIREQLKNEPDKKLLLSEIYENFEETDEEDGSVKRQKSKHVEEALSSMQEEYRETDSIKDLESWTKRLKKGKKLAEMGQTEQIVVPPPRKATRAITDVTLLADNSQVSLKEKMQNAFKKVKNQQTDDSSVLRKVESYLSGNMGGNQLSNVPEEDEQEGSKAMQFDYTSDGVQRTYNTLIQVQLNAFKSEAEKCNFYKRQSTYVLTKLLNKIKQNQSTLIMKDNTQSKLRLENHEINENLFQIKILLEQLVQEYKDIQDSKQIQQEISPNSRRKRDDMINALMNKQNRAIELEKDIGTLRENRISYRTKLNFNKKTLDVLDVEIEQKRKENKQLNKTLVDFYQLLLKAGLDSRSTGISWILMEMNKLKEKVPFKSMPDFLDQKAKEFLLQVNIQIIKKAVVMGEIDEMEQQLSESFKQYKQESQDNSISMAQRNLSMSQQNDSMDMSLPSIFPPDSNKFSAIDIHQARLDATKHNRNTYSLDTLGKGITLGLNDDQIDALEGMLNQLNQSNQPVTFSSLIYKESQKKMYGVIRGQSQADTSSNLDSSTILKEQAIRQYDNALQRLNKIKQRFQVLDDEQLHRIIKEFDYKQYGKRFNIDPVTVLSCMFGGLRCDREIVKNGMKKVNYQ